MCADDDDGAGLCRDALLVWMASLLNRSLWWRSVVVVLYLRLSG